MFEKFKQFIDWLEVKGYNVQDVLKSLLERVYYEKHLDGEKLYGLGWSCYDEFLTPLPPSVLRKLVDLGLVRCVYRSNKYRLYRFIDRDSIEKLLKDILHDEYELKKSIEKNVFKVPENLFDDIVGYDDLKQTLLKILKKIENGYEFKFPYAILLVGSPATGKSLFIDSISRLPNTARFSLAGITTRSGFIEVLINLNFPEILLIDEIDKVKYIDALYPLLDILEWKPLTIHVYGKHNVFEYKPKLVLAACNKLDKLPEELISRFIIYEMKEYTEDEMIEIVKKVVKKILNVDENLIEKVARKYVKTVRDVRQLINRVKMEIDLNTS